MVAGSEVGPIARQQQPVWLDRERLGWRFTVAAQLQLGHTVLKDAARQRRHNAPQGSGRMAWLSEMNIVSLPLPIVLPHRGL